MSSIRFAPCLVMVVLVAACWNALPSFAADSASQPNVLFILTDDQRADTIGALGNAAIKTPNLDALVRDGMAFRNAYCLGGNVPAVCTPSRNMLLSGRTYFRFGARAEPTKPNFPTSLKQAGYVTYHHGKKGNTAVQLQALFDYDKLVAEDATRKSGDPGKEISDAAIEFLKKGHDEKPFFMYLAYDVPHDPRVASAELMSLYERDKLPLPKNFLPLHPFNNGEMTVRDEYLAPWPRTADEIRKHLHDYYAVITGLDRNIGRVIQTLKDRGEYERTLIIFSSDQGLALGSHGLMGKQNLYDAGMKVPLVVCGPRIPAGKTSDALVYLHDIFPTVCDYVSAPIPAGLDGKSFLPAAKGLTPTARESLFFAYRTVQRGVRDARWKLLRYPQVDQTQLFDLQSDPDEMHNLAQQPEHAQEITRLTALLEKWQTDLGDRQPLKVDQPASPAWTPPKDQRAQSAMIRLQTVAGGIILPVKAQPGARRNAVVGEQAGALKVAVTEAPEKGKANDAIIEILSEFLTVKKGQLTLVSGATQRQKKFLLSGLSAPALIERLAQAGIEATA